MRMSLIALAALVGSAAAIQAQTPPVTPTTLASDLAALQTAFTNTGTAQAAKVQTASALAAAQAADTAAGTTLNGAQATQLTALNQYIADLNSYYGTVQSKTKAAAPTSTFSTSTAFTSVGASACATGACSSATGSCSTGSTTTRTRARLFSRSRY
jgi:hypothetical protein